MNKLVCLLLGNLFFSSYPVLAECPSMDFTGDCFVDLADFAFFAEQWLTGDRLPENMVPIPAGTFQMGDSFNEEGPEDSPVHTVTLNSFFISKYEITNAQYCIFLKTAYPSQLKLVNGIAYATDDIACSYPYCDTSVSSKYSQVSFSNNTFSVRTKGGRIMTEDPMVCVSWYGAVAYCNWRSQQEAREKCYDLSTWICDFSKKGYRLPTEAEWEYAARGEQLGKRFPWGDTITHSQANYYSVSDISYDISPTRGDHPTWSDGFFPYTSPVGSFPANGYGLYDMAGNVWEWCYDWYESDYYSSSPQSNPTGPTKRSCRVLRGSSWADRASYCRVSSRGTGTGYPDDRGFLGYGFRVVLNLKP